MASCFSIFICKASHLVGRRKLTRVVGWHFIHTLDLYAMPVAYCQMPGAALALPGSFALNGTPERGHTLDSPKVRQGFRYPSSKTGGPP